MSSQIKMPSVATPPAVIKVGGKCYKLASVGIKEKPDNSLANIQWTGTTCAACQAAGDVPSVCPCVSTWGMFPCGGEGENILDCYDVAIADVVPGASYTSVGTDVPVYTGLCHSALDECLWGSYIGGGFRIDGTQIGIDSALLQLVAGTYWIFYFTSGSTLGAWTKSFGDNPEGTYTIAPNGIALPGGLGTPTALSPTSIEVSAS